jgi:hypothetical protein
LGPIEERKPIGAYRRGKKAVEVCIEEKRSPGNEGRDMERDAWWEGESGGRCMVKHRIQSLSSKVYLTLGYLQNWPLFECLHEERETG